MTGKTMADIKCGSEQHCKVEIYNLNSFIQVLVNSVWPPTGEP
jgi:hypothetical protein